MVESHVFLDPTARQAAQAAMEETARFRHWQVHIIRVRSNHVHAVVTSPAKQPEEVERILKAYGTRRLNVLYPNTRRKHWWTESGSTRYLNDEASLLGAIQYVHDHDERGAKET